MAADTQRDVPLSRSRYDSVSIAKKGDSILVSVNHRLNILGYLDLSPFGEKYKNSANAGHADMVAALQWVHDNIACSAAIWRM